MTISQAYKTSGWMSSVLLTYQSRISSLLNQIASLGVPGLMKPAIFRKFLGLLSQVATEQAKEFRILSEIEAMEQKHRCCRISKKLEHANPVYEPKPQHWSEDKIRRKQRNNKGLWWFADLLPRSATKENCN